MHVHGTGKVRRRDSRYTESHTAVAVWLFLPIWEGEELFKAGDFFRFPFPSFQGELL